MSLFLYLIFFLNLFNCVSKPNQNHLKVLHFACILYKFWWNKFFFHISACRFCTASLWSWTKVCFLFCVAPTGDPADSHRRGHFRHLAVQRSEGYRQHSDLGSNRGCSWCKRSKCGFRILLKFRPPTSYLINVWSKIVMLKHSKNIGFWYIDYLLHPRLLGVFSHLDILSCVCSNRELFSAFYLWQPGTFFSHYCCRFSCEPQIKWGPYVHTSF